MLLATLFSLIFSTASLAGDYDGLDLRVSVASETMLQGFMEDVGNRRKTVLGIEDFSNPSGINHTFYSLGLDLGLQTPIGLYLAVGGRASALQDSDSKRIESDLSNLLTDIFIIPLSEVTVSTDLTLTSLAGVGTFGFTIPFSKVFRVRPVVRGGYGEATYKEKYQILQLTGPDSKIEYRGKTRYFDAAGGIEFLYESLIVSVYGGYRRFLFDGLEQHVDSELGLKVLEGSRTSTELKSAYFAVGLGASLF